MNSSSNKQTPSTQPTSSTKPKSTLPPVTPAQSIKTTPSKPTVKSPTSPTSPTPPQSSVTKKTESTTKPTVSKPQTPTKTTVTGKPPVSSTPPKPTTAKPTVSSSPTVSTPTKTTPAPSSVKTPTPQGNTSKTAGTPSPTTSPKPSTPSAKTTPNPSVALTVAKTTATKPSSTQKPASQTPVKPASPTTNKPTTQPTAQPTKLASKTVTGTATNTSKPQVTKQAGTAKTATTASTPTRRPNTPSQPTPSTGSKVGSQTPSKPTAKGVTTSSTTTKPATVTTPAETAKKPLQMRTLLSQFAVEFCDKLQPVCEPLSKLEELITDLPKKSTLHNVLPELRDVRHHIQVLSEKVKDQQAYVLIFGPLKSGKSTLMNGICASYVSEVTTLPAYPCLVNISYSKTPDYRAIQYDGKVKQFKNQDELHDSIQRAHVELTFKLREIEAQGKAFDPVIHMPSAFRKIDIKLTTPELATSSAVLVDTPGLYSRMKFGYDQMTRDFRNTAACAIFVVKSDNLFLEQVFEEFTELLDLFSRIFLIVNLDTRKQDLGPDGELVPSLEQKDPQKIIDAFRNLAMSAPLKEAVDDGRLRIYPVDLLSAASARIRNKQKNDNKADSSTTTDIKSVESFEKLRGDLINYLNSNDYLKAFLVDSVRRASSLMTTIQKTLKNPAFAQIKESIQSLENEKKSLTRESKAIETIHKTNWQDTVAPLRSSLVDKVKESAQDIQKSSEATLAEIIENWWKSDASFHELKTQKITPYFKKSIQKYIDEITVLLEGKTANKHAGLEIPSSLAEDLQTLKIDLHSDVEKMIQKVKPISYWLTIESKIDVSSIPVKRRFLDWLLFRSARRVRRDVFGAEEKPNQAIPASVKEKRIGEAGREIIISQCRKDFANIWNAQMLALPEQTVKQYVELLSNSISAKLQELEKTNKQAISDNQKAIAANTSVLKEAALTDQVVTDTHAFIQKKYPLPAWPDNTSHQK